MTDGRDAEDHVDTTGDSSPVDPKPTDFGWTPLAAQVLGVGTADLDRAAAEQPFLRLGGTSLRAIEFAALVEARLGRQIDIGELLGPTPLAEVAATARMARDRTDRPDRPATVPAGNRENGPDLREASALQNAMLLDTDRPGGTLFHLLFSADIRGTVEADRLRAALHRVTLRHEALRTVFVRLADGALRRRVLSSWVPRLIEQSISPPAGTEPVAAVHALLERATAALLRPFERPPVVFLWTHVADDRSVLSVVIHHAIADGWSIGLLWKELAAAYHLVGDRPADPPHMAPSQERLIEVEQADVTKRALADRLADLAGAAVAVELPTDLTRSGSGDRAGCRLVFAPSAAARRGCDALVTDAGLTRNAVLLAAWALVVGRRAAVDRLVLGLVAANRPDADALEVIGPCLAVLPLRCALNEADTVAEYLHGFATAIRTALASPSVPFEQIVAGLGAASADHGRNPLVQIAFAAHDELVPAQLSMAGAALTLHEGHCGGSVFDATLYVQSWAEGPRLALEFRTDALRSDEAAELAAEFDWTLGQLAGAQDRPLVEIRTLTEAGRRRLIELGTGPATDHRSGLWQLIEERARRCLDAIAVRDAGPEATLTYRQLLRAVEAQSAALASLGVRPGDCVGLAVSRSAAEIVAILAVIRVGACYTGIAPDLPSAVAEHYLTAAGARFVLGDHDGLAAIATTLANRKATTVGDPWRPTDQEYVEPAGADPDRVAYIAFTSGSTGVPKGTRVPHRAVLRLVDEPSFLRSGACEHFLRLAPLAFDASTLEVFAPLAAGGCVEVYGATDAVSPNAFADFVASRRLTGLWLTAGLFRLVADYRPDAFTGVRQTLTGGDVVPPEHVRKVLRACPGLRISNGYGPTENTTFSTVHHVDDPAEVDDPLPIGRPIQGTSVAVLDATGRLTPRGGIGELYVHGAGLALGYAGLAEETDASFGHFSPELAARLYRTGDLARWDDMGRLCFVGRRDRQVKVRGVRVELDAVARAICDHPAVEDALVVATTATAGGRQILAGIVAPAAEPGITESVRAFVAQRLPSHSMPVLWAVVDSLPVTANGKVDVAVLEARAIALATAVRREHQPTPDDLEEVIAMVWTEVLGDRRFGVHDRFFDVGGDSILMLRAAAGLEQALPDRQIMLPDLFVHLTIKDLADHLRVGPEDSAHRSESPEDRVAHQRTGQGFEQ